MPRQRGGGRTPARSAPSRPIAAPARPAPPPQQTRSASTAAQPPVAGQQKPQAGQGSGLFGQMASTAAGVAVGSSIGHAVSGFFGGGTNQTAESQQENSAMGIQSDNSYQSSAYGAGNCEGSAKAFTRCLDENAGSQHQMNICSFYLDQLKACQSAASQY